MITRQENTGMSIKRFRAVDDSGWRSPATAAMRRRRGQAGQSAIVAVIVLFLLLFLAGIFIAIISNNIRGTSAAARATQADRFADAGVRYLDDQLTNSPEGADWRNIPDCAFNQACTTLSANDPDYTWLRPCMDANKDGVTDAEPCGYTRVNFGSDIAGGRERGPAVGGRALVRVSYRPTGNDPLSRYIRLDAVGRVGQIDPRDPTTYGNSQGIAQKVERVAYKAIGLNEYVRQITNKDNKPGPVALGAPFPVRDRDQNGNPIVRNIENILQGPIRVNAPLTFYGINRIQLNPSRNEAIEVAGSITLNEVSDTTEITSAGDATQVFISTIGLGQNVTPGNAPNLLPSASPLFTTLGSEVARLNNTAGFALIRDNPRGSETGSLPIEQDKFGNQYQNLRSVGRTSPPLIDAAISADGLTRYRALTRDSAPLPYITDKSNLEYSLGTGDDVNNRVATNAGTYGYGQGLYIDNNSDVQSSSSTLFGGYSLRNDWLNPRLPDDGAFGIPRKNYWRGDFEYVPPAITITLTPRGFVMELSPYTQGRQAYYFRDPASGQRLRSGVSRIYRYTPLRDVAGKPASLGAIAGMPDDRKFAGYPALEVKETFSGGTYYEGDFVIHAEGNVRVRGVAGGVDPETKKLFVRHLTIVSNQNIYVDGNLLRDNITPELIANPPSGLNAQTIGNVRGRSTIALLAKNNVAINTTQFMNFKDSQTFIDPTATGISLTPDFGKDTFVLNANFGPAGFDPVTNGLLTPSYLTGSDPDRQPFLMLRHTSGNTRDVYLNAFVNQTAAGDNPLGFSPAIPGNIVSPEPNVLTLGPAVGLSPSTFAYDRFTLPLAALYPQNQYPFTGGLPTLGLDNRISLHFDANANVPGSTPGGTYLATRVGVVPLDIRIEAMMYAQEGAFFIIPGPWFNPNPNDTVEAFLRNDPSDNKPRLYRDGEVPILDANGNAQRRRIDPRYPFYREPMDVRITFCGSITENRPAEIADQGAWMEKWGWVPSYYGSTGLLNRTNYPSQQALLGTAHGPVGTYPGGDANGKGAGNGLIFEFDPRSISPYSQMYNGAARGTPLRANLYNPTEPLPFAPRLPVAPGLLYSGSDTTNLPTR